MRESLPGRTGRRNEGDDRIGRVSGYRAGRRLCVVVSPRGRSEPRPRAQRAYESTLEQDAMNVRLAYQRMELLLYANFSPQDLFLTLTYSDDRLPQSYAESQKRIKAFVRRYRAAMLARGRPCPYLYVIEGQHGDKRIHHHLVCEQPLGIEELQTLWGEGHCFIERIRDFRYLGKRGIPAIALYITKEPRKTGRAAVGRRMWTPSLGLNQPERIDFELPPGQPFTLPEGTVSADDFPFPQRHDFGRCTYSIYNVILPQIEESI